MVVIFQRDTAKVEKVVMKQFRVHDDKGLSIPGNVRKPLLFSVGSRKDTLHDGLQCDAGRSVRTPPVAIWIDAMRCSGSDLVGNS